MPDLITITLFWCFSPVKMPTERIKLRKGQGKTTKMSIAFNLNNSEFEEYDVRTK